MRLRIALGLVVVALLGFGPVAVRGAITTPYSPTSSTNIAPGVRYDHGTLVAHSRIHDVNVVAVDLDHDGLDVRLSQANGVATDRALVTEQATDYSTADRHVVATTNGSTFFYIASPDMTQGGGTGQGLNVSDGELINAGAPISANAILAFGVTADDVAMIGTPAFAMQLALPGGEERSLNRVNQRRQPTDVVLYTPRFQTHTWTDNLGDEYVIEGFDLPLTTSGTYGGTVVAVNQGMGNTPIGPGQVVLSVADGAAAQFGTLAIGDDVSLTLSIEAAWQNVINSVGGRNMLTVDGQSVVANKGGNHPRAAVGIRADGSLVLLTTDGGDLNSGGMSLHEMASLMLALGAVDAVNLDGGNSTQMAVRQPGESEVSLVNARASLPEDFRPVVNALQVVSDSPPILDDVTPPSVSPPQVSLAPLSRVGKQNAALDIAWSASDDQTVAGIELGWRIGNGSWRTAATSTSAEGAARLLVPYGRKFAVRLRATDGSGNVSDWSPSRLMRVVVYDESSGQVTRGGGWLLRTEPSAFGGAYRRSKTSGAWSSLDHGGLQAGAIGHVGPRGGDAELLVDGVVVATVPTNASVAETRRLLFVSELSTATDPGISQLTVRNAGDSDQPLVELDAFVVLEPAS